MGDTPENKARLARIFEELRQLSEEIGFYDDPTPEEIVATVKQVRKEMAEERQKYNESVVVLTEGEQK